ncbi:hypothetical protein Dtox_0524 [Desulfofarcimen acetoxidans DSM 771]|uniref:Lipoprotein n=1 Tax=Desulfofarcimen acetoxidans (strain ATCC 49208 / DSM 771 / KCTC 5769 / VKM B-1644 / 5575) TaxID=485916 RepID=C8W5Y9_DESAS|nr:hypothetical protein [Desulfofarcimen acetoxidans]ACV61444.1 hypothetical protein Dtox_0524 [Desulfofarcimen acetoxidans DSM 771]
MLKSKKIVSILLAMMIVLSIGCLSASAEESVDTTSRGYQLINGDVYDLHGNLLLKMYDGFTADGYALDPNFTVHDPSTYVQINEDEISLMTTEILDTTSRGYQLIDGDVYDLHGNLLIKMYDGFTADGYTLDPNFTVHDPGTYVQIDEDEISLMATEIFNGTKYLNKNIDGNQGVQLGGDFTVSSSEPNWRLTYNSGVPTGVNFGVYNVTRGTVVEWVPKVLPGKSLSDVFAYTSSRSNDVYRTMGSAEGSAGHASLRVVKC